MGLVNKVVPADALDAEVEAWCREILALSPTALAIAKRSFNADSENIRGIGASASRRWRSTTAPRRRRRGRLPS